MTEWTVVTVIVVLVGLFFTIGKPILGVIKELQGLRYDTDHQEKEINRDIESIKELSKIAQAHENRIMNQEDKMSQVSAEITELLRVSQSHEMRIHDLEQDVGTIKSKDKGEKEYAENSK